MPNHDKCPHLSGPPAKVNYWFARYSKETSKRERILFLYFALGSLPGGFDGIPALFKAAGEEQLGHELLREIEALRAEDDERGPALYECSFDEDVIKKMESILIKAAF